MNGRIAADAKFEADLGVFKVENKTQHDYLQANIDTEAATRLAADNNLQANIDAEETSRIAGDAGLQTAIDTEVSNRTAADTTLQANIDAEETARIAGDAALQAAIDAEVADRTAADNTLQANIDAEATTRDEKDTELADAIAAEASTRAAEDQKLQTNIDTTKTELEGKISVVDSKVEAITAGADVDMDTLREIVDAYQNADSNVLLQVSTNRTDLNYLLKVVGSLLKNSNGVSGHTEDGFAFREGDTDTSELVEKDTCDLPVDESSD
jgi:hypothetical protein